MFQPCQRRATFLRMEAGGKKAASMHYYCKALGRRKETNFTKSLSQELVYKSRGEKGRIKALFCRGAQFDATPLKAQNATSLHVLYPLLVNLLHCPSNLSCPYCYLTVLTVLPDLPPLPLHRDVCMCRTAAWWQGVFSTMRCKIFCTCRTNCRQSNN